MKTAEIRIIDLPYQADRAYSYIIPDGLEDTVVQGTVAEVPFGRGNRITAGLVTGVRECGPGEAPDEGGSLKEVISCISDGEVASRETIDLCLFLREHTLCTFGEALRSAVPSQALSRIRTVYALTDGAATDAQGMRALGDEAGRIISYAGRKGTFTRQSFLADFPSSSLPCLDRLVRNGTIARETEIRYQSAGLKRRILSISAELSGDGDLIENEINGTRGSNRKAILRYLADFGETPEDELFEALGLDRAAGRRSVSGLVSSGSVSERCVDEYRNPFSYESILGMKAEAGERENVVLSEEQESAAGALLDLYGKGTPEAALLHGVTGSGKTNVILSVMEKVVSDGRGVIMLVPEIALTPQTVMSFVKRFGDSVAVIHSGLSAGERYDAWRRIRDGGATVVVGTRSAVFAPVKNLGMIVIDEEHETTYKSDTDPKYLAHDVAAFRAGRNGALMVLSSATPSLTSYHKAKSGKYKLIELGRRYGDAALPQVIICDMRDEVARGNLSPVGAVLADKLRRDKADGNQSIIFLNRRGYSNYVSCRSCGRSLKCPNCSVTLTYHSKVKQSVSRGDDAYEETRKRDGYLVCHMCGYRMKVPDTCPECGKDRFMYMGFGTQKAEDDIADMFPDLRILRMDRDTTTTKFSHEEILSAFRRHEGDVLLGTQMVTKGHDFPKVATVGVLNADSSQTVDDYRASERMFSMLTQVIGRAGRASVPGVAIIQTYTPENRVIAMAADQDYKRFYGEEIKFRKAFLFPPFCDIAVITVSSADEAVLGRVTCAVAARIREMLGDEYADIPATLFGPFEAPVYRAHNICRMRIVMKCRLGKRTRAMLSGIRTEFLSGKIRGAEDCGNGTGRGGAQAVLSVDLNPTSV